MSHSAYISKNNLFKSLFFQFVSDSKTKELPRILPNQEAKTKPRTKLFSQPNIKCWLFFVELEKKKKVNQ